MAENVRVRFAPSPTGSPHIGNFRTALFNWLFARHTGGKFILRIEDTDRNRYSETALDEIIAGLTWLGLDWDEGPDKGGAYAPYFQSERLPYYQEYALKLVDTGHAYYCFCTPERLTEMRKAQEACKQPPRYDRKCMELSSEEIKECLAKGMTPVIRFKIPDEGKTTFNDLIRGEVTFENSVLDDFVILKSDGFPTYHLASVVDDHLMEISHVLRAEEWISSTPKHILLNSALGFEPPKFAHLTIILGPDRSKLSKRHGATSLDVYRSEGYLQEAMVNFMSLLGWSPGENLEILPLDEIIKRFSFEGVTSHPAIFDITKLQWMNAEYIRAMDITELARRCVPFLADAGLVPENPAKPEMDYIIQVIRMIQDRMKILSQCAEFSDFFFKEEIDYDKKAVEKWLISEISEIVLRKVQARYESLSDFSEESVEAEARGVITEMGIDAGKLIHPLRVAVTGKTVGPGLFETIATLGKRRVLKRLDRTFAIMGEEVDA